MDFQEKELRETLHSIEGTLECLGRIIQQFEGMRECPGQEGGTGCTGKSCIAGLDALPSKGYAADAVERYDSSLWACMESVSYRASELRQNPFEELGRAVIRAEQDVLFNKTMVEAWKRYILDNNMGWDT